MCVNSRREGRGLTGFIFGDEFREVRFVNRLVLRGGFFTQDKVGIIRDLGVGRYFFSHNEVGFFRHGFGGSLFCNDEVSGLDDFLRGDILGGHKVRCIVVGALRGHDKVGLVVAEVGDGNRRAWARRIRG